MSETIIWQEHPGHIRQAGLYTAGILALAIAVGLTYVTPPIVPGTTIDLGHLDRYASMVLAAIGLFWIILAALRVMTTTYTITTERLRVRSGIFSTTDEELELRRVQDMTIVCPLAYRISGRGNVIVEAADVSSSEDWLSAVRDPERVADILRSAVDSARAASGVREVSMLGGNRGGSGGRFVAGSV